MFSQVVTAWLRSEPGRSEALPLLCLGSRPLFEPQLREGLSPSKPLNAWLEAILMSHLLLKLTACKRAAIDAHFLQINLGRGCLFEVFVLP